MLRAGACWDRVVPAMVHSPVLQVPSGPGASQGHRYHGDQKQTKSPSGTPEFNGKRERQPDKQHQVSVPNCEEWKDGSREQVHSWRGCNLKRAEREGGPGRSIAKGLQATHSLNRHYLNIGSMPGTALGTEMNQNLHPPVACYSSDGNRPSTPSCDSW